GPWETTTLIGGTCKRGNAFSGPVLIARGLDFEHVRCCYGVLKVCRARKSSRGFHNFGGLTGRETPLPIPNREVKPARADGTRRATSRESRSPPIYSEKGPRERPFFMPPRRYELGPAKRDRGCAAGARAPRSAGE